jgi:zinc transporter 1/2/3
MTYESTAAAIAMAGALITFLLDYIGTRLASKKTGHIHDHDHSPATSSPGSPDREKGTAGFPSGTGEFGHSCGNVDAVFAAEESWRVLLLEAGIIFHSYIFSFF